MQFPRFIIKGEEILNRTEIFEGKYWEENFISDNNEKIKFYYILLEDIQSILPDTYYIVIEVNRDRFDYNDTFSPNTNDDGFYIVNSYIREEIIFKSYIKLQPLKDLDEKINAEINLQALQDFGKDLTLEEIAIITHDITKNCLPLFRNAFIRCNALERLNEG